MIYLKSLFFIQFFLSSLLISTSSSGFVPPVCFNGYWTQFFNRDGPNQTDDTETLTLIFSDFPGKACSKPTAIDVRAVSTGRDYRFYKQKVTVSPSYGFKCVNKDQADGKQCLDYTVRFCCPGILYHWGSWSSCSRTCGAGYKSRKRSCRGSKCTGSSLQTKTCANQKSCLDTWYHWGSWSSCSRTCGSGYQYRKRSCKGSKCTGSSLERKSCAIQKICLGFWSKWGSWSSCSRTCSMGYERRKRTCTNSNCIGSSFETRFCYNSCTGTWYHWGSWSSCSRTCGTGYQYRRRSCKGSKCTGSSLERKSCTNQKSCFILPPVCNNGYWTQFFNRDGPSQTDDTETLTLIFSDYPGKACSKPTAIDVRAVSTGRDYRFYKQKVTVSPSYGFKCVNKDQPDGKQCLDYKVRFCCPKS